LTLELHVGPGSLGSGRDIKTSWCLMSDS